MRRMLLPTTVLAAATAVTLTASLASGNAAGSKANTVAAKLVGKWTRTVIQADVTKSGGYGVQGGSKFTLTVKKSGAAVVASPSIGPPFTGKIVAAGGSRVHINIGTPGTNVWTWRVSGGALTFTKVKDSEPDRVAVFEGVWKRQ